MECVLLELWDEITAEGNMNNFTEQLNYFASTQHLIQCIALCQYINN